MKASFIIPLYNGLPLTQAMLASLRATLPVDLAHEIILVDDGSTDGTREWLAQPGLPGRVLLNERNSGFASSCNRGAAIAQSEFLFFLNNDLVLLPGWLEPMLAAFARFPAAGVVGNIQVNFATGAVDHAGIFFNHKGKPEHRRRPSLLPYQTVTAVTGACCALRGTIWRRLGGFDEGYRNGCEDVDLCLQARAAGLTNHVATRSVVRHHVSASAGRKLRDEQNTARLLGRWRAAIIPHILTGCSRACLATSWDEPRNYPDTSLARQALLYLAGFLPVASPSLLTAAASLLNIEQARWDSMFSGLPARSPREIAWQFSPLIPEDPPVI